MTLLTKFDKQTLWDRIIVVSVVVTMIFIGCVLELFVPTSETMTQCAYECSDGYNHHFDSGKCTGTDPNSGEEFTIAFKQLDQLKRYSDVYVSAYLNDAVRTQTKETYQLDMNVRLKLSYYNNKKDTWEDWADDSLVSTHDCRDDSVGACEYTQWIKEPYVVHPIQRLTVKLVNPDNKFSNICFTQVYGTNTYTYLRIIYALLFCTILTGYIIFYIINMKRLQIYPSELGKQQYLNIGLLFMGFLFNDPLDLFSLIASSPVFPIIHAIANMIFIGYIVFYIVAFFQSIRIVCHRGKWSDTHI